VDGRPEGAVDRTEPARASVARPESDGQTLRKGAV